MSDPVILKYFLEFEYWTTYECSACKGRFCFENMKDTVEIMHPVFCPICGRTVDQVLRAK